MQPTNMAYSPETIQKRTILSPIGEGGSAQVIFLHEAVFNAEPSNLQDNSLPAALEQTCEPCQFFNKECSGLLIFDNKVLATINLESLKQVPQVLEQANCLPRYQNKQNPQRET